MTARLDIYRSRSLRRRDRWHWRLIHQNGQVLATGGEGYAHRSECEAQAMRVVAGDYRGAITLLLADKIPPPPIT